MRLAMLASLMSCVCVCVYAGRWPADPTAFVKMKAALGVQLAQTIETSLGLTALASETCVDVYYEGFAYRLTLYSGR